MARRRLELAWVPPVLPPRNSATGMRRRVRGMVSTPALTALLIVSRRRARPGGTGPRSPSVLGLGLLVGRELGTVLAVTRGSVVSHFEIRIALNFIASSVVRRLLHRVRGSERTPLSHRFLLT
jgi:hypothetical protein